MNLVIAQSQRSYGQETSGSSAAQVHGNARVNIRLSTGCASTATHNFFLTLCSGSMTKAWKRRDQTGVVGSVYCGAT